MTVKTFFFQFLYFAAGSHYFELSNRMRYHIQPNYRTVHLGFSKALGKLVVKYSPNKGTL